MFPGLVPSGEYVVLKALTGFVSDPIDLQYPISIAAFYRYQAEPTPTPTATRIPEPTATATATATVDPSVTATATATVDPSVTVTATARSEPTEPGSAIVTVETSDGSEITDDTSVCLADDCESLDSVAALVAAAPFGTQVAFTDIAPGVYPVTAFIDDDQVFDGTIEIFAVKQRI